MDEINRLLDSDIVKTLLNEDGNLSVLDVDDIPTDNYAIIEFGDEYVSGDAVEYHLLVKPGEVISKDTVIAEIYQDGMWKPLQSIF